MVLIVSDRYDNSTGRVMEYLNYYSIPVLRVNLNDDLQIIEGVISNAEVDFVFEINGRRIKFSDFKFYWYRRGAFRPKILKKGVGVDFLEELLKSDVKNYEYFFNDLFIKKMASLGDSRKNSLNKLTVLMDAASLGLDIPKTTVTTKKNSFENQRVISKGVFDTTRFSYKEDYYTGDTVEVDEKMKKLLPPKIPLTGVQERIVKDYEVRSFYLKGEFYNMAILSQTNPNTVEDFRNYDRVKPNRTVPCDMPGNIEEKLQELYEMHRIDSCSTDLVKTKDDKYVLLDINPVGQFGMLGNPSNYLLERRVAREIKNSI